MNDPRHKLTAETQGLICGLIRAGAFPHVAAEAAGIPQRVFERWVRYGQARQPAEEYRAFAVEVMKAKAHARALAEAEARKRAPVTWLRSGPGRETDGKPGWTGPVRPATVKTPDTAAYNERWWKVFPRLLEALAPFPEARAAAAAVLAEEGVRRAAEIVAEVAPEDAKPQAATEGAKPQAATDAKPQAADDAKPQAAADGEPTGNLQRTDGEPRAKPSATKGEGMANRPPIDCQMAANLRPIGNETPPDGGPMRKENRKSMAGKPAAWDALDAGHWTVWSG